MTHFLKIILIHGIYNGTLIVFITRGLSIIPEANLVSNIGVQGTHSNEYYKTLFLKYGEMDTSKIISLQK